ARASSTAWVQHATHRSHPNARQAGRHKHGHRQTGSKLTAPLLYLIVPTLRVGTHRADALRPGAPSQACDRQPALSEIVFDLTVHGAEFAVWQIGVANEDVFVAGDHLLGREQAGAGIDDVDAKGGITHRNVVDVTVRAQEAVAHSPTGIAQGTWPQ